MTAGWPARLQEGPVGLRPLRMRDATAWRDVRTRNASWLRPWEATVPLNDRDVPHTYGAMVRRARAEAREGRSLPFALTYEGTFIGQVTVGGIARGSLLSGYIGYWIDQRYAGRGVMPTAVAMATDHCFTAVGLHRIEINIRPENAASLRVVEKLGFRFEGMRLRYLHIDGDWRDHSTYALCADEVPGGVLARWRQQRVSAGG
ncbi:MAG: GNAT family N-acetyltransferase [Actinomycetales bacterium]|nr:GNAT family N-acetyltransferase [Actinomycetales bacterium]